MSSGFTVESFLWHHENHKSSIFEMTALGKAKSFSNRRRELYSALDLGHSPRDLISQSGMMILKSVRAPVISIGSSSWDRLLPLHLQKRIQWVSDRVETPPETGVHVYWESSGDTKALQSESFCLYIGVVILVYLETPRRLRDTCRRICYSTSTED